MPNYFFYFFSPRLIVSFELAVKLSPDFSPICLGPVYMRLDTRKDGLHAFLITRSWAEMTSGVDAVFSYNDNMYLIKVDFEITSEASTSSRLCSN